MSGKMIASGLTLVVLIVVTAIVVNWLYKKYAMSKKMNAMNNAVNNASGNQWNNPADMDGDRAMDYSEFNAGSGAMNAVNNAMAAVANTVAADEDMAVAPAPVQGAVEYATLDSDLWLPNDASSLSLDAVMPASFRDAGNSGSCASLATSGNTWVQFAPTKAEFNEQLLAAGSVRMGMNTRVRNPTGGVTSLLQQRYLGAAPPVPMKAMAVPFGDSSFRQDLVQTATGAYPTGMCA